MYTGCMPDAVDALHVRQEFTQPSEDYARRLNMHIFRYTEYRHRCNLRHTSRNGIKVWQILRAYASNAEHL